MEEEEGVLLDKKLNEERFSIKRVWCCDRNCQLDDGTSIVKKVEIYRGFCELFCIKGKDGVGDNWAIIWKI